MKTLMVLTALLFSLSASAEGSAVKKFSAWLSSISAGRGHTEIMGSTPDGQVPCRLVVGTVPLIGTSPRSFWVSVGFGPDLPSRSERNTYLWATVESDRNVEVLNGSIKLRYNGTFIANGIERPNVSHEIELELLPSGQPRRASGHSDLTPKRQVCLLDEASVS